jgi:hypothetical protein
MTNAERLARLKKKIDDQVTRSVGKGLNAGRIFLTSRIKETLSVPAPRIRIQTPAGEVYYKATTPATPGAPPRKLSGRLRTSVTSKMLGTFTAVIGANARGRPTAKYPQGFNYPAYHEVPGLGTRSGEHPFIRPTILRYLVELTVIVGKELRIGLHPGRM